MGTYGSGRRAVGTGGAHDGCGVPASRSRDPSFEVVGYVPAVYQAGFEVFAARADKAWSLTDCISFGVMTAHGLSEALTADHHFEQAGFRAVFKK